MARKGEAAPAPSDSDGVDDSDGDILPYEYSELQSENSIRLLRLKAKGKGKTTLECEVFEVPFENKPQYEALSWSWGNEPADAIIHIHGPDGTMFVFDVPATLERALQALRRRNPRQLWIDAICINQMNANEKNRQVPMMARIYGLATSVCVWIGPPDNDSKIAFDFIKHEVLRLENFDALCEDQRSSKKWNAIYNVMKREWFSRRWVVQEIALANKATIYCGRDTIPWKDFADAVQLFVEVETATHRLSEVMQKDPNFYHVPMWFEYVSALGASLLVDATGTLFRKTKDHKAQPLLRLEHLVSTLTIFKASIPHDTIYSLLAIAKDARPIPVTHSTSSRPRQLPALTELKAWAESHANTRPFSVDYTKPIVDVCKDFIAFCVRESEPTRALDIICRPWAPVHDSKRRREGTHSGEKPSKFTLSVEQFEKMPSWIPTLQGAAYAMNKQADGEIRMDRQSADPLVGLPDYTQRNYNATETKALDWRKLRFKKYEKQYSMFVTGFVCDQVAKVERPSQNGSIPREWIDLGGWTDFDDDPPEELWRTLVADRGRNGRNPPTYYSRACKESIDKGLSSGALNTEKLIKQGRCSVIAEFFRRVQAVIWNRALMRTKNENALGIVGKKVRRDDLICVLHGCSVPVILRPHIKSAEDVQKEEEEYKKDCENWARTSRRIWREKKELKKLTVEDIKKIVKWSEAKREWIWNPEEPQQSHAKEPSNAVEPSGSNIVNGINGVQPSTNQLSTATQPSSSEIPPVVQNGQSRQYHFGLAESPIQVHKAHIKSEQRKIWYEFLGECYVHGLMDGEAIKKQNEENIEPQMFELR